MFKHHGFQNKSEYQVTQLFRDANAVALAPYRAGSTFQDAGITLSDAVGEAIGRLVDQTGNGYNANQTTAAAKPTLGEIPRGGRRNRLLYSNAFSTSPWVTAIAGTGTLPVLTPGQPDRNGGNTAWRLQCDRGAGGVVGDQSRIQQTISNLENPHTSTVSIWAKSNTGVPQQVYFRNITGAGGSAITVTPTWQRFSITGTVALTTNTLQLGARGTFSDQVIDILISEAQLEIGTLTDYQAVGPAYQVTESGVPSIYNGFADGGDSLLFGVDAFGTADLFCTAGNSQWIAFAWSTFTGGTILAKAGATEASRTFQALVTGANLIVNIRGSLTTTAASASDGLWHFGVIQLKSDGTAGLWIDGGTEVALNVGAAAEESQNITMFARTESALSSFFTGFAALVGVREGTLSTAGSLQLRQWGNQYYRGVTI